MTDYQEFQWLDFGMEYMGNWAVDSLHLKLITLVMHQNFWKLSRKTSVRTGLKYNLSSEFGSLKMLVNSNLSKVVRVKSYLSWII